MLPFLRRRDDGVGSGPVESLRREPDEGAEPFDMLGAVADDLIEAIEKKNKKLLRDALEALCSHIQEMDEEQDEGMA